MSTGHMEPRGLANFRWMARHRRLSTRSKMHSALASIPSHSCRKMSLKQSAPAENDEAFLREPRQRGPRQGGAFSYREWQAGDGSRLPHGEAVGCPARRALVNWDGGRVQRRRECKRMRRDRADYELIAPGNLQAVVSLLADEPGKWLPIAGGTDVMVLYAAGKLPARKLVSIWNLPELRVIEISPEEIRIGAGCTYTELRDHGIIAREFPLLARAARWTGGIANQNRGTLGGNIVNASPAADSLPALMVYEAELILVSRRGERRVP